jgi:pyruvate/2-oxoacid:ferredoxin oxidoreductase alpha subunit/NAD-dependent dihydropyrimidine dehydrogenase PreA subunit
MGTASARVKPVLHPEYCKGCGRCVEACARHCIEAGHDIHPGTGLVPVVLDLDACTACGLCLDACPEPYGLEPLESEADAGRARPAWRRTPARPQPYPLPFPGHVLSLPARPGAPLVVKGPYASAIGALLAGCRHFFGYPITPSTEGAELMARLLPRLDGVFVQAVSEVAAVNLMYGCGGAGLPALTFTSSPGFSLMLEGISYMIGAEVPGVFVNVMRGGPGLGNIAPEQSDVKLACRGLGHGNTHAIVLCPATPQEMLDLTRLAFWLSFTYRNPVVILSDGYLGQMTGKVELPATMVEPQVPEWAVFGDQEHRRNLISSIQLSEADLEAHNRALTEKYRLMAAREQRADLYQAEDAEVLLVAANTPARMAKGAVRELRERGVKAGLLRPQTLWPFPIDALTRLLPRLRRIVVVEASPGQIEDEMRLALSHADAAPPPIARVQRYGGVLPSQAEVVAALSEERERLRA